MRYKIILVFIFMALFGSGCATSRGTGAVVSDIGSGATEYRAIQGDIREGEAELAITGTRIEAGLGELERSINGSQGAEKEIGAIIQRVRERPVGEDIVEEWRNRRLEGGSGGGEAGENKS